MANVLVDETSLEAIADTIRSKLGVSDTYLPSEMADAIDDIGGGITPTGTKQISITQNGTTTEDVTNYASAEITANVPNSYTASDEGKVVNNGALVSQSSDTVTDNGTYDTTLINSLLVDVASGGGDYFDSAWPSGDMSSDITTMWADMFAGRTGITSISLPQLQSIPNKAFERCTSVQTINVPNAQFGPYGQSQFAECTNLRGIVVPKGTNAVYSNTFQNCSHLQYADLVTSGFMQSNNFQGCSVLTILVLRSTSVPTLSGTSVFNNTPFASSGTGGTLYVPQALLSQYTQATNWSTILGYANNQILPIEGSIYETQYADGTPIT